MDLLFIVLLIGASVTDFLKGKIYNWITLPATIVGLTGNTMLGGMAGFQESALGMVVCFVFFTPFFLLGGIGAGDVKFMMAVGAFKGWRFSLIGGLYGAIVAGITVFILLICKGKLGKILQRSGQLLLSLLSLRKHPLPSPEETVALPYTPFLAAGLALRWLEILLR